MSIVYIQESYASFGLIRYFEASRCFNDEALQNFNRNMIKAKEPVTFDCGLMELREITRDDVKQPEKGKQILAVIIRPEIEPNRLLDRKKLFEFRGYDLVDSDFIISSITNCGTGFDKAISYQNLNSFGLISSYREAVLTQLDLNEKYPDESHAYCDIAEIWRYLGDHVIDDEVYAASCSR